MGELTWYGHLSGPSSAVYVSRSVVATLRAMGFEVDAVNLRSPPAGIAARMRQAKAGRPIPQPAVSGTAVVMAFPEWTTVVPRHNRLIAYVWVELDEVEPRWIATLDAVDEVCIGSEHGAEILRRAGLQAPVTVVHHGIAPEYKPAPDDHDRGTFRFLHLCAGELAVARKGTAELLSAWDRVAEEIPEGRLTIMTSSAAVRRLVGRLSRSWTVDLLPEGWRPPAEQAGLYQAHSVLVQPSRAECFGLLGLEALATGLPVVTTTATGHAEWALEGGQPRAGIVPVRTGQLAPCAPGPGRAPALYPEDVRRALLSSYYQYGTLRASAVGAASDLAEQWSWARALGPLARLLHGQRYTGP